MRGHISNECEMSLACYIYVNVSVHVNCGMLQTIELRQTLRTKNFNVQLLWTEGEIKMYTILQRNVSPMIIVKE